MNRLRIYAFADEADPAFAGQLSAMKRNGLQGLEIRGVDGKNCADLTLAEARDIRRRMDAAGLTTYTVGSPIGKMKEGESFAEHFVRFQNTLAVADILGAENIRVFSFFIPSGCQPAGFRETAFEYMFKIVEAARDSGITLCHENEKGIYGDTPERCLEILETFPTLRAIFDPANFVQCGVDTFAAWELLSPYVKYLHIKDALPDGRVVPAGKGVGNVAKIVKKYIAAGGEHFTVEPHLTVFDGLATLERSGDTSAVGTLYTYETADTAFDAAVTAFRGLLL